MAILNRLLAVTAGTLTILGFLQSVRADSDGAEAAVQALAQHYVDAWNHSDAEGIASQFVAKGDLITPAGMRASGYAAIRAFYDSAFRRGYAGSRAGIGIVSTRAVRRDVIVADGTWFIENARTPSGAAAPREEGIATLVAVKTPEGWRISAVREQTSASAIKDMQ